MKQIVWLHSHFLYWMGGTKFIFEVAKRLHRLRYKGHSIQLSIVVEAASELALEQYRQEGIEVIVLGGSTSTHPWYWLFLPWYIFQRQQQLKQLFTQRNWLNQHTTVVSSMFPMNAIANSLEVKHVQLCYEPFAFFHDPEFVKSFPWLKRVFIYCITSLYSHIDISATKTAHTVLTLNKVTQAAIHETYCVSSHLVYAGVDMLRFKPYVPTALRRKYRNHPIAIHSTDYSPVKGTDRVIQAMQLVVKTIPKAKLLITTTIQNPEAEARLKALAASLKITKQIEFLGFLPIKAVPHYYSLAQVLVQGSNSAKSGTTSMALPVKEAMSCGTPAIRPDVGGDDVVDGVSGYLVDPAQTAQLANAMTRLLGDKKLSRKFGLAARDKIIKTYTWEKTVDRIVKHL